MKESKIILGKSRPSMERTARESIKCGHGDAVGCPIFSRSVFRPGYANASLDAGRGLQQLATIEAYPGRNNLTISGMKKILEETGNAIDCDRVQE